MDLFFAPFADIKDALDDPCPDVGTWSLESGRQAREVGEYVCYPDTRRDGAARIDWTQRELGIVAIAVRDDGDFDALINFWNDEAGPE
jgi:hypothetical protein